MEELRDATITHTGGAITVLFRKRDTMREEQKIEFSQRVRDPVHFMFYSTGGFKQEWWTNGDRINPFGGLALQTITDTHYLEHYYQDSLVLSRDGGPSLIEHTYGKSYREEWAIGGLAHRVGGPAITDIRYNHQRSGQSSFSEKTFGWYRHGVLTNPDSWSRQIDTTGSETIELISGGVLRTVQVAERTLGWYDENGDLHRVDGPAALRFTGLKEVSKTDRKPAWKWEDWHGDWYVHGEVIPNSKIIKWAKANNIGMWNEPCYNHPAFCNSSDEVCFMTDIVNRM